ncbi:NAD(P)H-hydrate dehydratase [Qingshengfaniella alkalisoli]|uniref:ADP-dependent (S)-NAD(P)H-hydrate dehydratase n=1 Tax=Qingshengfaniella alkalisoli TaxID=2599296 RepID=A0A5B8J3M3_9RHOB|nr:NAD(P)H-hydrate dehydratase [Qingshengfaniella alkalisoli]QDY68890.1 NAD(P)H-hydrate dehydratase [Qingshengfaniella alkalisoli]
MTCARSSISPALVARLAKKQHQHKFDHGHVLVLAGGVGKGGAARIAARSALRVGVGLVTLGCPSAAMIENAAQLNAIMLTQIDGAPELDQRLEDPRINAICIGPGIGRGEHARHLVRAALRAERSTVLDADGLSTFADDPVQLLSRLHPRCVMTPHMGEFMRLFPVEAEEMRRTPDNPVRLRQALHRATQKAGCVILLKGAVTRISDPAGHVNEHHATGEDAVPWLATAGAGDALSGIIAGLLARDFSPMEAAHLGAYLHAEAARDFGPGLIAEDIPEMLPDLFIRLGL